MDIKVKKKNPDGIVRLETAGKLKEVIINEDFLNPKDASIALCFRGENSSGIVEITPKEADILNKELHRKSYLLKDIKVMKFKKD